MAHRRGNQYITRRKVGGKRRAVQVTKRPGGGESVHVLNERRLSGTQTQKMVSRAESDRAVGGRVSVPIKGMPIEVSGDISEEAIDKPKGYATTFVREGRKTAKEGPGYVRGWKKLAKKKSR